ncbi:MotA/TolQ/ExbB proton channel family protein [Butyrivibrio sp. YAB3001]|uniref:MotA/TolQ/ExbB proton channel family protein n=1 Tax=Butyrivibrio sp. YAB3001 TaxID=1520812 RepID=UPI0008F63DB4|nr:MotA/TolQ/ExbB proton channel family protein [Butyrivibrio sp. YAB3001]SFC86886.1 MotA/TolQ/ExbB proton channel family protein [Butyrivibrio sp. YAB3001]
MGRTRKYEILILLTYIAMSGVCVYLQFFSKNQAGSLANLIVNITMLVLVGAILTSCAFSALLPTMSITSDLSRVTAKIEEDALHAHEYLWAIYNKDKEELFHDKRLLKQYKDYKHELDRIVHNEKTYYKCDIEDYIGYDMIDDAIHRERMNQVAGVMTGLGILGTFVGLSLGLENFNTGTTAEITGSIEPLMNGIKVAFHTSIYGMVFSLVFNYVYKRRLDDAENAVSSFLGAYKKYVLPDTTVDGVNRMLELQIAQTKALMGLSDTFANKFSTEIKEILEPEFEHFDSILDKYTRMTTRSQMEQMERVVDSFVTELNNSMGNAFSNLSKVVNQSLTLQETNEDKIKDIYAKNAAACESISKVAMQMKSVADTMEKYVKDLNALENRISNESSIIKKALGEK